MAAGSVLWYRSNGMKAVEFVSGDQRLGVLGAMWGSQSVDGAKAGELVMKKRLRWLVGRDKGEESLGSSYYI